MALECYLVSWDIRFSKGCSYKRFLQKGSRWQRSVGGYFACPVSSLALSSCSKSSVDFHSRPLNPSSLKQTDRSFEKSPWILSPPLLKTLQWLPLFLKNKVLAGYTMLSHPMLPQPHGPLLCSGPYCPSSFLPQGLCTSVHLAWNVYCCSVPPIAGSLSFLAFWVKYHLLKEIFPDFPPPSN